MGRGFKVKWQIWRQWRQCQMASCVRKVARVRTIAVVAVEKGRFVTFTAQGLFCSGGKGFAAAMFAAKGRLWS
jgi:hypothetical protein